MKANEVIAFDVDGVLADLLTEWLARYNRDYNDHLEPKDIPEWGIEKFVKPECGFKIFDYLKDPTIYDNVKPYSGALEAVEKLKGLGYRIVYATSTPPESAGRKFFWLKEHGAISHASDYMEVNDKSLIFSDYLVDDAIKNIQDFRVIGILFVRPWNEKQKKLYRHVNTWNELIKFFRKDVWLKP